MNIESEKDPEKIIESEEDSGKMHMSKLAENSLKFTVLFILIVSTLWVCHQGPFSKVIDIGTTFQESYQDIKDVQDLKWPDVALCMNPVFKNKTEYAQFMDKAGKKEFQSLEEFNDEVKKVFYRQPMDILEAVMIGQTYSNTFDGMVPLTEPIVKSVQVDFDRNGFCAILSMEEGKKFLIQRGLVKENAIDADFMAAIMVKFDKMEDAKLYLQVIPQNDHLLIGDNLILPTQGMRLFAGEMKMLTVTFQTLKYMFQCSETEKILSPCLQNYIGNETQVNEITAKARTLVNLKLGGQENLKNVTNCLQPCYQLQYETRELSSNKLKDFTDSEMFIQYLKMKNIPFNKAGMVVVNHIKSNKIVAIEEVYQYDFLTFIGDSGGTIGVFLGFSFWSVYLDFLAPVINKICLKCCSK